MVERGLLNALVVSRARLWMAACVVVVAGLLQAIYIVQLQYTNSYLGYQIYAGSPCQILTSMGMVLVVICIVPHKISRPSDVFLLFYGVIVLMSCAVFSQVTGALGCGESVALFVTLLVPVMAVLVLRGVTLRIAPLLSLPPVVVYGGVLMLLAVAFTYGYSYGGAGGFDWTAMYERRLEGREQFESGSFGAYLLNMATNGLTPFVAFVGGTRRSTALVALGVGMGCFSFWLLGLKAPAVMSLLFAVLGYLMRSGRMQRLPRLVIGAVLGVCALALLERQFFENSLIAEVVVRRAFVVQGALQSYYWDVIRRAMESGFDSFMLGWDFSNYQGVTFFVGSEYLGNPAINANTNAFLVALAANGLFGFVVSVLFVGVYFAAMDALYRSSNNREVFLVVSLYSLLLTEQSYTVAFVSSGIGLLTVLVFLIRSSAKRSSRVSRVGMTVPTAPGSQ
ncbi:MAG: hypothetical protein NAOJABEB_00111 [Steroidobacteraceae bacterium]|nr:hypothetical protein [Steroidobacteraceae bacterium]